MVASPKNTGGYATKGYRMEKTTLEAFPVTPN